MKARVLKVFLLGILLLTSFFMSLKVGVIDVSWSDIFALFCRDHRSGNSLILFQLRLPRVLAAILIGSSLGTVGLVFQTLLRNPLAEPYTLGLSGGSSLGAVIALSLSLSPSLFWIPALSTIGCLFAALIVLILAHRGLEFESRSLILFGVMLSLFFGALVVTLLSVLSPDKLQAALFWLLGQLGTSRDIWIYRLGPFLLIGIAWIQIKSGALDALSLGEGRALSLGYSPRKERSVLILICTLLTSIGVSISGLVGFIGLVSPHLARKVLKTAKHSYLVLGSALTGGLLLVIADTVGRVGMGTLEIPAGSVAALFGAPLLIFLLVRQPHASNE